MNVGHSLTLALPWACGVRGGFEAFKRSCEVGMGWSLWPGDQRSLGEPLAVGGDGRLCGRGEGEGCRSEAGQTPALMCRRPELRVQEELKRGRERVPGRGSQVGLSERVAE